MWSKRNIARQVHECTGRSYCESLKPTWEHEESRLLVSYAHRMKMTTCEMQTEEENSALFNSDCRKTNMWENIKKVTLASIPSPKEICFSQLRTGWACVSQRGWSYWYEQHWDPLDWRQLHTKKELISTSCEAWTAEGETPGYYEWF